MARQRDWGLQFPSDLAAITPGSPLLGRQVQSYMARGSRYRRNFNRLGTGLEFPLGINFLRHLLPDLTPPPEDARAYAAVVDVRKTKLVDSLKEEATKFTSIIDVGRFSGDNQGFGFNRQEIMVRLTSVVSISANPQVWGHGWEEVIWDSTLPGFILKQPDGISWNGNSDRSAIHRASNGALRFDNAPLAMLSLAKGLFGAWRAHFDVFGAAFIHPATIVARSATTNALYDAQSILDPNVLVTNEPPWNRLFSTADVVFEAASINDTCMIVVDTFGGSPIERLIVWTETVNVVSCPPQAVSFRQDQAQQTVRNIALNAAGVRATVARPPSGAF